MTNRQESLAYLLDGRQKVYSPDFNAQSDGVVISRPGSMVQFYDDPAFIHDTLREFVGTGLHAGHVCILIASREHLAELEGQLADAIRLSSGHYMSLDVREAIDSICVDGQLDRARFMALIGGMLEKALAHGKLVRVYGEIAAVLWEDGQHEAAQQVEQFWKEVAYVYPFFLYSARPGAYQQASMGKDQEQSAEILREKVSVLQHEINHHRETEAALEQLEARNTGLLAEREHLMELNNAKDDFISLASHQLRTPATGVKQYIGMLLQGFMGDLTPSQLHSLQKAYESNERQLKIVNDLLLVARVDAGKMAVSPAPCDIVQLIRDVANEQEEAIHNRQQVLDLRLPKVLQLTIDARYMRMVLENLVNNASKYSADGLPIHISVRRRGGNAVISVKDNGVGISKEDLPKLYQKFSRIYNDRSNVVDGTGLGLYWSKRIIELHDGRLDVTSRAGHGSTFSITLPLP